MVALVKAWASVWAVGTRRRGPHPRTPFLVRPRASLCVPVRFCALLWARMALLLARPRWPARRPVAEMVFINDEGEVWPLEPYVWDELGAAASHASLRLERRPKTGQLGEVDVAYEVCARCRSHASRATCTAARIGLRRRLFGGSMQLRGRLD